MSIAFAIIFMLAAAVIVVVGIIIAIAVTRSARATAQDRNAPRLRAEATVVDKRSEITGGGESRARQHYFVTFQFPDGNRTELALTGPESGMLTPGDTGVVEWQGTRYVGFAREILR